MDEYVEISIDVLELPGQRAKVRKSLTFGELKNEIFREFEIDNSSPEAYSCFIKGNDRPINPNISLAQLDVQTHDEFEFNFSRRSIRRPLAPEDIAYIRVERTNSIFEIQWQPAVIGRPDIDSDHNLLLAVNLESIPDGNKVSRRHAQITFSGGRYYIENLSAKNPTHLNDEKKPLEQRRELHNGDKIFLSSSCIQLTFMSEHSGKSKSVYVKKETLPQDESKTSIAPVVRPSVSIEKSIDLEYQGKVVELTNLPFRIGRENCDLTIRDSTLSRQHAEISFDPSQGKYFISDLQSSNGVVVNNNRIPPGVPFEITPGTVMTLGVNTQIKFDVD